MTVLHPAAERYLNIPGSLIAWILLILALSLFSFSLYRRVLILLSGQPDPRGGNWKERVRGLALYGILQKRQPRYFWAGLIHFLIFWGFVVLGLRSLDLIVQGLGGGTVLPFLKGGFGSFYGSLKDLFELTVLGACIWAMLRRAVVRPARYELETGRGHRWEAYLVLSLIGFLMLTDMFYEGGALLLSSPASGWLPAAGLGASVLSGLGKSDLRNVFRIAYWAHFLAFFIFLNFLPLAKHFHILTALPNIYLRKLKKGSIKPARWGVENLEDLESLGVGRLEDFTWKNLLDLFTCTECGRCSDMCPAKAVGRPLSPKMITLKLRDYAYRKVPVFSLGPSNPELGGSEDQAKRNNAETELVGEVITFAEIWSCTTCGACEEECPVFIEYLDKIIDMRRHLIETAQNPKTFNPVLTQVEKTGNPFGKPPKKRADWIKEIADVPVRVLKEGDETEVLYFADSYASYDPRVQAVAQAVVRGLSLAEIDFGILGAREKDSGHQVRRLGEEGLFQVLLEENLEVFQSCRFKQIVTTDPHAFNTLKKDYPGNLPVVHYTQFFRDLLASGRLKPKKMVDGQPLYTYHDPCYLGRHNEIYEAPREILNRLPGLKWVEMARCRDRSFCCGGGDVNLWHEIEGETMRPAARRLEMAREAGVGGIVTACPFCLLNLEDAVKTAGLEKEMQVVDLMELLVSTL
jgi:Fe-S oxidoreductase